MDDVLDFLAALFGRTLVDARPQHVKTVLQLTDADIAAKLKTTQLPALVLTPLGENDSPGPWGDTKTRTFRVRARIVVSSTSSVVPWERSNPASIPVISEAIRAAIASDKQLGMATDPDAPWAYGLGASQPATDGTFTSPGNGALTARDIVLTYSRFEDWVGTRNPQVGLKTPPRLATVFSL